MADDAEKTEKPTARRRQEARTRGQVAKSQDLTSAILLLSGIFVLYLFGGSILKRLYDLTYYLLGGGGDPFVHSSQIVPLGREVSREMVFMVVPVLGSLFVVALLAVLLQIGPLATTHPLIPDLNKINPVTGLKRMFSAHALVTLLINVTKLSLVGAVVYQTLMGELTTIIYASGLAFSEMVSVGIDIFFALGVKLGILLLILGLIDFVYQRFKHERGLRMSKHEVKEEMRRMDGDPVMKRRRREVQIQLAMQRLKKDVSTADVVVTNPTHVAVALKYDSAMMNAPRVVAKGEGYMAQRIRTLAEQAGIPIVEKPPLARTLNKLVEVGREIPPHLYKAVAEVLAYVYELSGRRQFAGV